MYCPKCGAEQKEQSAFCSACGLALNSTENVPERNTNAGGWSKPSMILALLGCCLMVLSFFFTWFSSMMGWNFLFWPVHALLTAISPGSRGTFGIGMPEIILFVPTIFLFLALFIAFQALYAILLGKSSRKYLMRTYVFGGISIAGLWFWLYTQPIQSYGPGMYVYAMGVALCFIATRLINANK